jgi:hypothetical protein
MRAGGIAGVGWSVLEFGMFRRLAIAAVVSLAWGISASGVQAACRLEIVACNVACPEPRYNKMATCKRKCHTIICESKSKQLARSHLPESDLPADQLPQSRMPDSHLPD